MAEFRADGAIMRNELMGLGDAKRDVEVHDEVALNCEELLSPRKLEALFSSDAIAQKVVTKIVNQAVSGGVKIKTDAKIDDAKVMRWMRQQGAMRAIGEASKLAKLYYGGAAVVLIIDDGQDDRDASLPVRKDSIKSVRIGYVADSTRIKPETTSLIGLKPRYYLLSLAENSRESLIDDGLEGMLDGNNAKIHSDRVLWMPGVWTPPGIRVTLNGEISQLALFWQHYKRYEAAKATAANILRRTEIINAKRKGLNTTLATSTADEEASIRKECQNIAQRMTALGVVFSDMDNVEFEVISRKLSDIKPLLDEFRYSAIAASGGLTEIDIFGVSTLTGSLARADERDRMITADYVNQYQSEQWTAPIEYLLELYFLSSESPTSKKIPEGFEAEFPSTFSPTPTEAADLDLKKAQAAKAWQEAGGKPKEEDETA